MTAGIPGTGIGGLFYLIAALAMPLRAAWQYGRGQRDARHLALMMKQVAMAVAIILAVWLTGVVAGLWPTTGFSMVGGHRVPVPAVFMLAPVILTFATLASVLFIVEMLHFVVARPSSFPVDAGPTALPAVPRPAGESSTAWSRSEEPVQAG